MSKASAGRRERRLTKKKQLGRPSGTPASLFKDRQRFAIAAWIALMPDYGPHDTARFVTVLIQEDTPIQFEDIEGLRLVLSAGYKAPACATLDEYAMALSRKAKLVRGRATGSEFEWLGASASALRVLVLSFLHDDLPGMRRSLDILRNAGWGKTSERVGRRLKPLSSHRTFRPATTPLARIYGAPSTHYVENSPRKLLIRLRKMRYLITYEISDRLRQGATSSSGDPKSRRINAEEKHGAAPCEG